MFDSFFQCNLNFVLVKKIILCVSWNEHLPGKLWIVWQLDEEILETVCGQSWLFLHYG